MARLNQLDRTRPLTFVPSRMGVVADPTIKDVARKMRMPQLLNIAEPIDGEEFTISGDSVGPVLDWLASTEWGAIFERDLQCIANDKDGRPLLTTWLSFDEFIRFTESTAMVEPLSPLAGLRFAWAGMGADEVYFDGYKLK